MLGVEDGRKMKEIKMYVSFFFPPLNIVLNRLLIIFLTSAEIPMIAVEEKRQEDKE